MALFRVIQTTVVILLDNSCGFIVIHHEYLLLETNDFYCAYIQYRLAFTIIIHFLEPSMHREAQCSCGQVKLVVDGEPVRIAVCHCYSCQLRTGSTLGVQARFNR